MYKTDSKPSNRARIKLSLNVIKNLLIFNYKTSIYIKFFGVDGTWTHNLSLAKRTFYLLNYNPYKSYIHPMGFEPMSLPWKGNVLTY